METTLTTAAGTNLNFQLGFTAHSVIIDNLTNAWATVPATGRQIAPWQHSVVVAIPGTQQADVRWQTPAGIQKVAYDTSQQLIATYSSDALPSALGMPTQSTGNAGILLGQFTAALGASTTSQPFLIPQGVDGLFVMIDSPSGFPIGSQISVADPTLTRDYGTFGPIVSAPLGTGWLVFPVEPSIDSSVVVVANLAGAGPAANIRVLAITHPAITLAVLLGNETPISIIGSPSNSQAGQPVLTAGQGGQSIQVGFATHATATVTLAAGTATQRWHVLAITASLNAGGVAAVNASDGVSSWGAFVGNSAARSVQHFDFPDGGMSFAPGAGVTITISDGGAGVTSNLGVVADLRNF